MWLDVCLQELKVEHPSGGQKVCGGGDRVDKKSAVIMKSY